MPETLLLVGPEPLNPKADVIGTDKITVNWDDPTGQLYDQVGNYTIELVPVKGTEKITHTAQPNDARPVEISGLTAFEKYNVNIYTVNKENLEGHGGGPGTPATPLNSPVQTWPERKQDKV